MSTEQSPDEDAVVQEERRTLEAIREGLASIARGEGIPLDEAIDKLRMKHGIDKTHEEPGQADGKSKTN
jgi:hypothetical protein